MQPIKNPKIYILISLLILIPCVISLFMFGLNFSDDFVGGSVFKYRLTQPSRLRVPEIVNAFLENGTAVKEVMSMGDSERGEEFLVRTEFINYEKGLDINEEIMERYGPAGIERISFETFGPVEGKQTIRKLFTAILVVFLGILVYLPLSFRKTPKRSLNIKLSFSIFVSVLYDVALLLGFSSIFGYYLGYEVGYTFGAVVLAIISFSLYGKLLFSNILNANLRALSKTEVFIDILYRTIIREISRAMIVSLSFVLLLMSVALLGAGEIIYVAVILLIGVLSVTLSTIIICPLILLTLVDLNRGVRVLRGEDRMG